MDGKDPVAVIRKALVETLVPYYSFAGRLSEGREKKHVVECTGEGVLFIRLTPTYGWPTSGSFSSRRFRCIGRHKFLSLPLPRSISGKNPTIP
ncbi:Benzyl alcohol O-benzoyltransferase [Linum perenne]